MSKPLIVIIGRQNVGKSTLFNKLVGKRIAIVDSKPGITRDFNRIEVDWQGKYYDFLDTGGLFGYDSKIGIMDKIEKQVIDLFSDAALILFLVDGREGILPGDKYIADLLRRTKNNVLIVVNKLDNPKYFSTASNFYPLGFGEPVPISAAQGLGIGDLLDVIISKVRGIDINEVEPKIFISIAGRPNVGKSSLLNTVLNRERAMVHNKPGTTRDPVRDVFKYKGKEINIVDTAGYRRISRLEDEIEYYSIVRAWMVYSQSSLSIVMIDASLGFTRGDWRVLNEVYARSGAIIICINKIDLIEPDKREDLFWSVKRKLKSFSYIPIITISALYKKGIEKLLDKVLEMYKNGSVRISKKAVEEVFRNSVIKHLPPLFGRKKVKIYYFKLVQRLPHIIIIDCNYPEGLHDTYLRYLEKRFRDQFNLEGIIIKLKLLKS